MSTFEVDLDAGGRGSVKVDGEELEVRSFNVCMVAGEVAEVTIVKDAFSLDIDMEVEVTILDPVTVLAEVWEFYRTWGETTDPDSVGLWEDLGNILRGGAV